MRGSVEKLRAVIWYADIRGFTPISDSAGARSSSTCSTRRSRFSPLRSALAAARCSNSSATRARLLFFKVGPPETCRRASRRDRGDAGARYDESGRAAAGSPVAKVDLALHIGEVLYGNVGATDRLDFTVIGPAVNEAARIEALCEPLGRPAFHLTEFAAATIDGDSCSEFCGAAKGNFRAGTVDSERDG